MIKFDKIKVGDVLWDVHRVRMGNTKMTRLGSWSVEVFELRENGAIVSWNGNEKQFYSRSHLQKLRRSPYKEKSMIRG